MLPEIFAVGSAVSSFIEEGSVYRDNKKRQGEFIDRLKDLQTDPQEAALELDAVSDAFNPVITQDLNQLAVSNAVSGVLNPVVASSLIGEKASALVETRRNIDDRNLRIGSKIAEVASADLGQPGVFNFLSAGIQGYGIGSRLEQVDFENKRSEKMLKMAEDLLKDSESNDMPSVNSESELEDRKLSLLRRIM